MRRISSFANNPQTPVIDTDSDAKSGYEVTLERSGRKARSVYEAIVSRTFRREQISAGEKFAGGGWANLLGDGDPVMFRVAKYWPDFAMKDGVPVSLSDQPHNPAVLVQVTGPTKLLPAAPPKPAAAAAAPPLPQGLVMRIAPAKEPGRIVYEMERAGKIEARAIGEAG